VYMTTDVVFAVVLQHTCLAVWEWLGRHYPRCGISRGPETHVPLSLHSIDLNLIDVCLLVRLHAKCGLHQHC
jgi:hypothetical protein